jgi:hypothetical protein
MSWLVSQVLPPPLTYSNASSSSTPSVGATAEGRHELSPFLLSSLPGGVQHHVPALKGGGGGSSNGVGGGHGGEDGERRERAASARPAHQGSPTLSGPASEPSGGLGEF